MRNFWLPFLNMIQKLSLRVLTVEAGTLSLFSPYWPLESPIDIGVVINKDSLYLITFSYPDPAST